MVVPLADGASAAADGADGAGLEPKLKPPGRPPGRPDAEGAGRVLSPNENPLDDVKAAAVAAAAAAAAAEGGTLAEKEKADGFS